MLFAEGAPRSSMSAPGTYRSQFVSVSRPHCQQIIMGIVWAVPWRRDIRNGTFHYYRFVIEAVGTKSVSFPKPISVAWYAVDRSHRLGKLLFGIHPLAQFLSSILVNNSYLIFIARNYCAPYILPRAKLAWLGWFRLY
jgi:hypothetical protein